MKKPVLPKIQLSPIFAVALLTCSATPSAYAIDHYWDNDGVTAGFGSAAGTWAAPTTGNASQGWSTSVTGELLPGDVTTTTSDNLFFGNGATGLAAGSITISGTVAAANITFASGSGNIVLDGGTISAATSARTISVGGGVHTINSVLSGGVGRTVTGAGTLVLNGLNTFTGAVILGSASSGGTLRVNSIGNLSAASSLGAPTTATNGLIQIGTSTQSSILELSGSSAAQTTNRQVRVGANAGGSGGATIRNNNTDPGHSLTFSNATFNQNNTGSVSGSNRTLTLGGSNTGNNTISGAISELLGTGVMPVTKTGTGTWILNGANTYDGNTTVNDGILVLGGSNSLTTTTTVSGTGTLQLNSNSNGGLASGNLIFGSSTAVVQAITADRTITNQAVLNANGTISGDFGISLGNLLVNNAARELTNNVSSIKSLTVASISANGDHNLVINGTGSTTVAGNVNLGAGTLTKTTGGMLKFSTAGSNTATDVIIHGGAAGGASLAVDEGQHISTGDLNLNNSAVLVIDYGSTTPSTSVAPLAVDSFTVGTGLSLLVQGSSLSSLAVGQSYPLVTWTTSGPADGSAFTTILNHRLVGTFSVSGNTLRLTVTANAAGSPISWNTGDGAWDTSTSNWLDGAVAPVSTNYSDTLDAVLFGDAAGATGNPVVTLNSPFTPVGVTMSSTARDYTISGSGSIGGITGLTLGASNTRTLTLSTANTYTGATVVDGGTLRLGDGGSNGSLSAGSAISVASGAAFAVKQSDIVTQGTDFGAISGDGGFVQSGGGTTQLNPVNTFIGSTSINSGNLQIGSSGRLGNGNYPGNIAIASGSSFQYASTATQTLSGIISGQGSLVKSSGSGDLTLSGANAYEGGTTVNGMINLANIAAIPSTTTISMADGAILRPTLDGVIVDAPISLGAVGTTVQINAPSSGTTGGQVQTLTLNDPISGDGNLRLFGSANLNTNGTIVLGAQSNYTGSTELHTAGSIGSGQNLFVKIGTVDALPPATVLTLDGGPGSGSGRTVSFDLSGFNQTLAGLAGITTRVARNQRVTNTGSLATLTINSSSDSEFGGNGPSSTYNGNPVNPTAKITGNLAVAKTGTAKFTLLGTHEYTGNTTVSQGILSQSAPNTFNDASTVSIASGAFLELNFDESGGAVTDTVDKLFIGGVQQNNGVYKATDNVTDSGTAIAQITGNGTLTVTTGPTVGYTAWAATNAGSEGAQSDFDKDGVSNGVEFFMNAAAGFTANPQLNGSNAISWTNGGNIPASAYGTQFVIQTSSNLTNWVDVLVGDLTTNTDGPGGSLTYTLTGGSPRFVRLKVSPN